MNKKTKFKIGMVAVIYMLILYIWLGSTFGGCAKDFYKEYKGVAYRNSDMSVINTTVILEGQLANPYIGKSEFRGTITYEGTAYETSFKIDNERGVMIWDHNLFSDSHAEHLGYFFSDDNLDQITIALMEEKDNHKYGWRPVDGLTFSGSASGRTEAVEITRKLMAKSMYGEYM